MADEFDKYITESPPDEFDKYKVETEIERGNLKAFENLISTRGGSSVIDTSPVPFTPSPPITEQEHTRAIEIMKRFVSKGGISTISQEEFNSLPEVYQKKLILMGAPEELFATALSTVPIAPLEVLLAKGLTGLASKFASARGAKAIEAAQLAKGAEGMVGRTAQVLKQVKPGETLTGATKFGDVISPVAPLVSPIPKTPIAQLHEAKANLDSTRLQIIHLQQSVTSEMKQTKNVQELIQVMNKQNVELNRLKQLESEYKQAFDNVTFGIRSTPTTKLGPKPPSGMTPDDVVAPGHTPNALNKDDFALLESKSPPLEVSTLKGKASKLMGEVGSFWKRAYSKLEYEPTGRGKAVFQQLDEAHRSYVLDLTKEHQAFKQNYNLKMHSEDDRILGDLLNRYESLDELPWFERNRLKPEIKKAFEYIRPTWSRLYDDLVSRGIAKPERKLESYLFHIWPKEQIVKAWEGRRDAILNELIGKGLDAGMSTRLRNELSQINENINSYRNQGIMLYRNIPESIKAPFLEQRKGGEGYDLFAGPAFERWLEIASRKKYYEPAIKKSLELTKGMRSDYKQYAQEYMRDFLGYEPQKYEMIKKGEHIIASLEYIHAMGFNTRVAMQNLTQELNTLVEVGPTAWSRGLKRAISKEGRAEFEAAGLMAEIPGLTGMTERAGALSKTAQVSGYLHAKTESALRRHAYAAGIEKALSEGKSLTEAYKVGRETEIWTQFLYGKMAGMQFQKLPGATIASQFGTYGLGQLELFEKWARNNPKKLVYYLALANGIPYAAGQGLDYIGARQFASDLWGALGIGVDPMGMAQALKELAGQKTSAAWIKAQESMPRILGGGSESGPLPSFSIPSVRTFIDVSTKDLSYALPTQVKRVTEATRALLEGIQSSKLPPTPEMEGMPGVEPRSGYLVRELNFSSVKEDPKFLLSPIELANRTFLFKPWEEAKYTKSFARERIIDAEKSKLTKDLSENILPLVAKGREFEAFEKMQKYDPMVISSVSKDIPRIAKEMQLRGLLTQPEYLAIKSWNNTAKIKFRIGVGQSGDPTRSIP